MKPPTFPYAEISRNSDSIGGFRWNWRIVNDEEEAAHDWGSRIGRGIAMTKLGAKWSARRAWKQHLKKQNRKERPPEYIPL